MRVVMVTGTNGKTTTVHMIHAALAASGIPAGLASTVETRGPGWSSPQRLTTPDAAEVQRILCRMRAAKVQAMVIEVSSHAIDQHRIEPVVADVAVFTNLSPEHLDYHGTTEQYYAAKAALFTPDHCRRAVVNIDDSWGIRLAAHARVPVVTVGRTPPGRRARRHTADPRVSRILLSEGHTRVELITSVPGGHSSNNLAAAYVAARMAGASRHGAITGLAAAPPPGRFQYVDAGQPFSVVIDFAHTPDAVNALIEAARSVSRGGRVHLVVGCAGNRDRFNRPDISRVALTADTAIFTTDDPFDEEPDEILAQMLVGTIGQAGAKVLVEPDRKRAIAAAIGRALPDDVVLIAGRGHERYQIVKGTRRPFCDVEVAVAALEEHGWTPGCAQKKESIPASQ